MSKEEMTGMGQDNTKKDKEQELSFETLNFESLDSKDQGLSEEVVGTDPEPTDSEATEPEQTEETKSTTQEQEVIAEEMTTEEKPELEQGTIEEQPEYASSDEDSNSKKKGNVGVIVGVCSIALIAVCVIVVLLTSQKGKAESGSEESTETASSSASTEDGTTTVTHTIDEYKEYLTLGEYKGITVELTQPEEVTDEAVEEAIQSDLSSNTTTVEVTDRDTVQSGDIANIDYVGYLDGEAFDNGSDEGYDLTIGSGTFIDGFEDGLIGATVGDTVDVDVTFPDDYSSTDLAGQAVVFKVTVNSIKESQTPELTDEWVQSTYSYDSVDEYREAKRTELEEDAQSTADDSNYQAALTVLCNNATVNSYPEDEVESYEQQIEDYYDSYASYYGTDLETFMSTYYSMSLEDFYSAAEEQAKQAVEEDMICKLIADAEGIEVSDDELETQIEEYATQYGCTVDEFKSYYDTEQVRESMLMDKVMEFVLENVNS